MRKVRSVVFNLIIVVIMLMSTFKPNHLMIFMDYKHNETKHSLYHDITTYHDIFLHDIIMI